MSTDDEDTPPDPRPRRHSVQVEVPPELHDVDTGKFRLIVQEETGISFKSIQKTLGWIKIGGAVMGTFLAAFVGFQTWLGTFARKDDLAPMYGQMSQLASEISKLATAVGELEKKVKPDKESEDD